jgi:hypothetical protein
MWASATLVCHRPFLPGRFVVRMVPAMVFLFGYLSIT